MIIKRVDTTDPRQNNPTLRNINHPTRSFDDAFTALLDTGKSSKITSAEKAEFLRLSMMSSALSIDGTAPLISNTNTRLDKLTSKYNELLATSNQDVNISPSAESLNTIGESKSASIPSEPLQTDLRINSIISRASRRYGVDENLIKAVIKAESNFKSNAVSSAGAQGLMQLMPATAAGLGVKDPFNAEQNIMGGTRFLKDLLNRYGGNLDKALAAYNWGPGNIDRGRGKLPQETKDYLVKVKKFFNEYSEA